MEQFTEALDSLKKYDCVFFIEYHIFNASGFYGPYIMINSDNMALI